MDKPLQNNQQMSRANLLVEEPSLADTAPRHMKNKLDHVQPAALQDVMSKPGIGARALRSVGWLVAQKLVVTLTQFGAVAILAHTLTPNDFGLMALSMALFSFMMLGGAGGITTWVIYDSKEGREERLNAAFWLNLTLTLFVLGIVGLTFPLVSHFYREPRLSGLIAICAVGFLFQQMRVVPDGLIRRSIEYQKLVIRDTAANVAASVLSVMMALTGWGVWSLVVPSVALQPVRGVIAFAMARWLPSFKFGIEHWGRILRYSVNISGRDLLGVVANQTDTLLIGKALGSAALGVYSMAYQTANMISNYVGSVVGEVTLSALSAMQHNLVKVQEAFLKITRLLAVVCFPLLIGLFVVADDFVKVIFGDQWEAAVLPMRIFIIFAIRRAISWAVGSVFLSMGRPDIEFKFSLAFVPFSVLAIMIGSLWGIVGVAVGITLVRTVGGIALFIMAARLISLSLRRIARELLPILGLSLGMASIVWVLDMAALGVNPAVSLIVSVTVGGIVYLSLLVLGQRQILVELIGCLQDIWPGAMRWIPSSAVAWVHRGQARAVMPLG